MEAPMVGLRTLHNFGRIDNSRTSRWRASRISLRFARLSERTRQSLCQEVFREKLPLKVAKGKQQPCCCMSLGVQSRNRKHAIGGCGHGQG
jgi:hypothetical protein